MTDAEAVMWILIISQPIIIVAVNRMTYHFTIANIKGKLLKLMTKNSYGAYLISDDYGEGYLSAIEDLNEEI